MVDEVAGGDELNLQEYVETLLRRWWVIAAVTAVAVVAALGLSFATAPVYLSAATVAVDRTGSALSLVNDLPIISQQSPIDTLIEVARSRSVAELAAERLGFRSAEIQDAGRSIQRRTRALRVRGADMIRIEARGPSPDDASRTANAVADTFLAWHVEMRRAQASAARQFIETQLHTLSRELSRAEEALTSYKARQGQVSISEQTTLAVEKLAEFEAQRRVTAAEGRGVEAALTRARASLRAQAPTVSSSIVTMEDPVSAELRQELAKQEIELAGLLEDLTPKHPQVLATQARIAEVRKRLREQVARKVASSTVSLNPAHQELLGRVIGLEIDREALSAKERALAGVVGRYVDDARMLPTREMELARLTREFKVAEQTYLLLSERLQEAKVAEASVVGDLRIVDRALPPLEPTGPRHRVNAMLGGLLGLLAGVGAAFVLEAVDATFKTPDEVSRSLGVPLLATIPLQREPGRQESNGQIAVAAAMHPRSAFAEAFRHLRTSLLYCSPDRPLRRILITSAGPGEGKGTVAANLAVGFAQAGRQVWLLECDLRKPALTEVFQPKTAFGLSELLVDGLSLEDALHETNVANLFFLPGGTVPPNPSELLGSSKMKALLDRGGGDERLVVLDAPPVLPVTDAEVLAPLVDGVVLVVHLAKTPRVAARQAKDQLARVGARLLGVVVNGVPAGARRYSSYYAYYSEDGGGGSERKVAVKPTPRTGGME